MSTRERLAAVWCVFGFQNASSGRAGPARPGAGLAPHLKPIGSRFCREAAPGSIPKFIPRPDSREETFFDPSRAKRAKVPCPVFPGGVIWGFWEHPVGRPWRHVLWPGLGSLGGVPGGVPCPVSTFIQAHIGGPGEAPPGAPARSPGAVFLTPLSSETAPGSPVPISRPPPFGTPFQVLK